MKYLWLILSALVFSTDTVRATEQHDAIMVPIYALFDGMREGNGDKVRASFAEDAVMVRAHATLRPGSSPEAFARAVEQSEHVWDETIWDINIQVDDKLASVWTQFVFHLDGNLSHCGVNSFQLYKFDSGWKIIYLVDTFRQENCVSPTKH
jgi:hypothetical protein